MHESSLCLIVVVVNGVCCTNTPTHETMFSSRACAHPIILFYTASKNSRPDHPRPRTGYGGNPSSVFRTPTPCNDTLRETANGARLGKNSASPRASYPSVLHCIEQKNAKITPAHERDTVVIHAGFLGRPPRCNDTLREAANGARLGNELR